VLIYNNHGKLIPASQSVNQGLIEPIVGR